MEEITSRSMPLSAITRDPRAWPRTSLDPDRVTQFADLYEEGGPTALPPIEVVPDDAGGFILADGWHRVQAAIALGWTGLPTVVVEDHDDA